MFVQDFLLAVKEWKFRVDQTLFADPTDESKTFLFVCSGITAATQRTVTVPDHNATLVPTDADGSYDIDVALTAAGQAVDVAMTINHATASADAIDAHATQLTAVRTAGTVGGVRSTATSLATDTGGVYASFVASHVDGGGTVRHIGLLVDTEQDEAVGSAPIVGVQGLGNTHDVIVRSGGRTFTADPGMGIGSSGVMYFESGATDITSAGNAPSSGFVFLGSGNSDCNDAAGTGGGTGDVALYTGDALSTLGTSGDSGDLRIRTGASIDAGSGYMQVNTGAAGTDSGWLYIYTGNAGTGSSGDIAIYTGDSTSGETGPLALSTGVPTDSAQHRGLRLGDAEPWDLYRCEHQDDFDAYTGAAIAADQTFGDKYYRLKGTDAQALRPYNNLDENGHLYLVTGNNSGAAADDASQIIYNLPLQADQGGQRAVEFWLHIDTAITGCKVVVGLTDSVALEEPASIAAGVITITATDCALLVYDSNATTLEWQAVAADGGAADAGNGQLTVPTAPVANTDQKIRIEVSTDGATIRYYIDGTLVHTLTGDVGVSPDVNLYATIYPNTDVATHASKQVHADVFKVSGARA